MIASASGGSMKVGPGTIARDTGIGAGIVLGIIASPKHLLEFVEKYKLDLHSSIEVLGRDLRPTKSGVAEVVIPRVQPGRQERARRVDAQDLWHRDDRPAP